MKGSRSTVLSRFWAGCMTIAVVVVVDMVVDMIVAVDMTVDTIVAMTETDMMIAVIVIDTTIVIAVTTGVIAIRERGLQAIDMWIFHESCRACTHRCLCTCQRLVSAACMRMPMCNGWPVVMNPARSPATVYISRWIRPRIFLRMQQK